MTQNYPPDIVEFFLEIAIGPQYGQKELRIHKWNQDIQMQVNGPTTPEDRNTLERAVTELNALVQGITIAWAESNPNTQIYFAPPADFPKIEPHYVPPSTAFFWSRWSTTTVFESTILIASKGESQQKRNHHICAMLIRNLGLMKRSGRDPASIFYNGESDSAEFTQVDRLLVEMLYSPMIQHNMTAVEAKAALLERPLNNQDSFTRALPDNASARSFCYNCGAPYVREGNFCKYCGAPFQVSR